MNHLTEKRVKIQTKKSNVTPSGSERGGLKRESIDKMAHPEMDFYRWTCDF